MADIAALDTATRGHHPDSPSSLGSSAACPGFQNEQRQSEAADKGVLQHKATETRDLTLLDGDEEMEQAVRKAIAYEDEVIGSFHLAGEAPQILREVRLIVGDDEVTAGFVDLLVVGRRRAAIVDHKFGVVPVTPTKDNLQGIAYVLGALRQFSSVEEIEVHFFAPYQGWSAEEQRKKYVHTFFRREIPELELRIRAVIARKHLAYQKIEGGDWSLVSPKTDLCLWCARKADCPAIQSIIARAVSKHEDLVVPEETKEYRLDTPQRVAEAYRFANQLQTICESVKKRCVDAALTEGLLPEGFALVKSSRREVVDPRKVLEIAIDLGLSEPEAVALINIPITSFEKALKEKAAKGKGAAAVRIFGERLAESGATAEGKPFYFLRQARSPADTSDAIVVQNSKSKVSE